jgi:acyl-CoA reductase-like NAD-dependent aldehyde dehydrogenase
VEVEVNMQGDGDVRIRNFVDGQLQDPASGRFIPNYAPATGGRLGEAPLSDAADVENAYQAANAAQPRWASLSIAERSQMLRGWAKVIRQHVDELSLIDARDNGSPRRTMRAGVLKGAAYLDYFCGLAHEIKGETFPATPANLHYTKRQPYGVVGIIIPFNHPAMFAVSKVAPALAAGNTVVLKPAEQTPWSAMRIAELSQDHLPPGVLNVVQGAADTGRAIVGHPDIWRVHFTGGIDTGLAVLSESAQSSRIKRVTLELGGKNPLIVCPDVEPQAAVEAAIVGINFTRNQGQSCGSTSRVFVHETLADEVTEAVVERARDIKLGLPERDDTQMGSLVSREHQQSVLSYISWGVEEGARLCLGGRPPDGELAAGAYVEPTIFDRVDPDMRIAEEEIFGPVLSMIVWNNDDAMVQAVNHVPYGLTTSIYTNDISTALRLADRVQAGYVWVNGVETRWMGIPFGGFKNSGLGSEHSLEELLSYTQTKTVNVVVGS